MLLAPFNHGSPSKPPRCQLNCCQYCGWLTYSHCPTIERFQTFSTNFHRISLFYVVRDEYIFWYYHCNGWLPDAMGIIKIIHLLSSNPTFSRMTEIYVFRLFVICRFPPCYSFCTGIKPIYMHAKRRKFFESLPQKWLAPYGGQQFY